MSAERSGRVSLSAGHSGRSAAALRPAASFNIHVPFYLGAGAVALAIAILATGHSLLTSAEQGMTEAPGAAGEPAVPASPPIVVAVAAGRRAPEVTDAAAELARLLDAPIEVLHVLETDVIGDQAVDVETTEKARETIADSIGRLSSAGVSGDGHILRVVGDHGDSGRRIASFAAERHARMIVIGTPADGGSAGPFDASLTTQLIRHARCDVHLVPILADRPLAVAAAAEQTIP